MVSASIQAAARDAVIQSLRKALVDARGIVVDDPATRERARNAVERVATALTKKLGPVTPELVDDLMRRVFDAPGGAPMLPQVDPDLT